MALHHILAVVTQHIIDRSRGPHQAYLDVARRNAGYRIERTLLSCTDFAHGFAAMPGEAKIRLKALERPNLGTVLAYDDMLSTHQLLEAFPAWLKQAALDAGGTAQFAGGVPAMYDGVTRGQGGMELSLFSRDTIALSAAVALSHQMFDAALYLGVCGKIAPGLAIGTLSFGHLPAVFASADPMATDISNDEKTHTRQLYIEGKLPRADLLEAGSGSYHDPGICTFYGTANSNQVLMEMMGLHLPGATFIDPNTLLREVLTRESVRQALRPVFSGDQYTPITDVLDGHAFVNGVVDLLATEGSINHMLYLITMARATGILLTWNDFNDLSGVIPLLARVYLNGRVDVDEFQAAGDLSIVVHKLIDAGLLHDNVTTIMGKDLRRHAQEPFLDGEKPVWHNGAAASLGTNIVCDMAELFSPDGGLRVLEGNIGRLVIKVSAVKPEHHFVEAPARVSLAQNDLINTFKAGELERNSVAMLPYQGPAANGIPELHKLTPTLSVLQERGFEVALVTDGRMSGALGKVPAIIRTTPETLNGRPFARARDGDIVVLDAEASMLQVHMPGTGWNARRVTTPDLSHYHTGVGRDLFSGFRRNVSAAEEDACTLFVSAGA